MGEPAQPDLVLAAEPLEALPAVEQVALLVEEDEDGGAAAVHGARSQDLDVGFHGLRDGMV